MNSLESHKSLVTESVDIMKFSSTYEPSEMKMKKAQQKEIDRYLNYYKQSELRVYSDTLSVIIDSEPEQPVLFVFKNNSRKAKGTRFRSMSRLEDELTVLVSIDNSQRLDKQQNKKSNTSFNDEYKIGEYLYSSWGYDQTNIEFYKVVGKFGKHGLMIVSVPSLIKDETFVGGYAKPDTNYNTDKEIAMKVRANKYGVKINSLETASKTDVNKWHIFTQNR